MEAVCPICPRHCRLEESQSSFCRARRNVGGRVISENYGQLTALALDPIEKKPLRRFHPGSSILSAGSFGCNLRCPFCQNHHISMVSAETPDTVFLSPEELARRAKGLEPQGNIGVAYTYNEPLVGYEYLLDSAKALRGMGMKNVVVTNGYIDATPLLELLPFLDAMNIDLKGFTGAFYRKLGGDLDTVKQSISLAAARIHVEVTTLIIPGENDSEAEMEALSAWLASVREDIPLHISRFFPRYRYARKDATPADTIYHLAEIARRRLRFVYAGNC